jgi:hypothetical protein
MARNTSESSIHTQQDGLGFECLVRALSLLARVDFRLSLNGVPFAVLRLAVITAKSCGRLVHLFP